MYVGRPMCRQFDIYSTSGLSLHSLSNPSSLPTYLTLCCADAKPRWAPALPHFGRLRHCPRSVSLIRLARRSKGPILAPIQAREPRPTVLYRLRLLPIKQFLPPTNKSAEQTTTASGLIPLDRHFEASIRAGAFATTTNRANLQPWRLCKR